MGSLTIKPTILIVPGSFSPSHFYSSVRDGISSHGYEAITVDLPSVGRRNDAPAATMGEDAAYIKSITSKLADDGKDIVLVMHSYGGICGTESTRDLAKAERLTLGKTGGIIRIVYMTALVVPVGASLKDSMGDLVPQYLIVNGDYMVHDPLPSAEITFSDLPQSEALNWVKQMPEHSTISFSGELTYPGYCHIPVSYLLCTEDKIIPLEFQQGMIDMIQKESGRDVDVHTLETGHCPNASKPRVVIDAILKAADHDN